MIFQFSMPKNRLAIIMRRSSQQIYNVTIFYIFFMCFYGLWGVQLFGELNYHCVRKGTLSISYVPSYITSTIRHFFDINHNGPLFFN